MSAPDYRYPIGKFKQPVDIDAASRAEFVDRMESLPADLLTAVARLDEQQLETRYRDGGWTVRQVVHHIADSHLNAYSRFKMALTEDEPTIRPYDEARWAETPDARSANIRVSLSLLGSLHDRWVGCIRALPDSAFSRAFRHPEIGVMTIDQQLALYAWHGRHHLAHITSLAERKGWS